LTTKRIGADEYPIVSLTKVSEPEAIKILVIIFILIEKTSKVLTTYFKTSKFTF
jgi:hypothetical protein